MKGSRKEIRTFLDYGEWRYALLVMLLLVMAGVTSFRVVNALAVHPSLRHAPQAIPMITMTIMALTGGFLFLSGAFGIWAIRITNVIEARRRISRLVEDVDSLTDGIVALDPRGRITGMNAASRFLATGRDKESDRLRDQFPCLTKEDADVLTRSNQPVEIERVTQGHAALLTLRFRSQPSEDMTLVWISDITAEITRKLMDQQTSHFQLIGRIARGVANDFNNILCAITAHAGLMDRPQRVPEVDHASLQTILRESERGADLARQLIQLSRVEPGAKPTDRLSHHVENALSLLKMVLPPQWSISPDVREPFEAVCLSGNQVEQVVLNLGLLATEQCEEPGRLFVRLTAPSQDFIPGDEHRFEACIDVAAAGSEHQWVDLAGQDAKTTEALGVIDSVVRSIVEEAGGTFEIFALSDGRHRYRLWLPALDGIRERITALVGVPEPMWAAVRNWRILLARPVDTADKQLEQRLRAMGMQVETVTDLVSALNYVEEDCPYEAMIVDRNLLGSEATGLLKAILKLKPSVGLVVMCDSPDLYEEALGREIVFEGAEAPPDTILNALWRAQELADHRKRAA